MVADPHAAEPMLAGRDPSGGAMPSLDSAAGNGTDPVDMAGDRVGADRRSLQLDGRLPDLVARIGRNSRLGALERSLRSVIAPALGSEGVRAVIGGEGPLGHPMHPVLTDLPIGFWTSAFVVDLTMGKRGAPAAKKLVGLGVLTAVPTAFTGLSDYAALPVGPARRVSVAHAAANVSAMAMYAASWSLRKRDRWLSGVVTSMLAAGLATVGGALGGSLAFDDQLNGEPGSEVSESAGQ